MRSNACGLGSRPRKGLVGLGRIARSAGGVDRLAQALRRGRIEDVAGLLEGLEGVGIEHLRPHVAVVGRRIAVAGEDMPEVGRPVAHGDLRPACRCASSASRSNAAASIVTRRGKRMQVEVDHGRGDIFDRGEALVEVARRNEPPQQLLGHRRAGPVVPGKAAQHLRLLEPMLVELRRQLDEIGGDAGAGNLRIGDVGQQAVQRVAELVEQRARVVEAEQRRLAVRRLWRSS